MPRESMNIQILRQGSPTLDGADEILYFLVDPQTGLRLRLSTSAAHVLLALQRSASPTTATTEEVQALLRANFETRIDDGELSRIREIFKSLDLFSSARTLAAQLSALQRGIAHAARARILRQLPEICATIPFYAHYDRDVETLEALPIIGKTELREHLHELYVRSDPASYFWTSSSGSTGERVQSPTSRSLIFTECCRSWPRVRPRSSSAPSRAG